LAVVREDKAERIVAWRNFCGVTEMQQSAAASVVN
jgi:limonene-1,2-epoxide hydrolase